MIDEFLTVKGQKKIVKEIFDKFKKDYAISDIKMYPVTASEYLLDNLTFKKFAFGHDSIKSAIEYTKYQSGFFLKSDNLVVVFVDGTNLIRPHIYSALSGESSNYKHRINDYYHNLDNGNYIPSDKEISIAFFIDTVYHELSHILQSKENNGYLNFVKDIEKTIKMYDRPHYNENHDNYLSEIDADMRSIEFTELYLKNYPEIYDKCKDYIDFEKRIRKSTYNTYNFDEFFSKFYLLLHDKNVNKSSLFTLIDRNWYNVFFTESGDFKNVDYILSYLKFHREFNMDIAYSILSSTTFISSIDFSEISEDAVVAIKNIIANKMNESIRKLKQTSSLKFSDIFEYLYRKNDEINERFYPKSK